MSASASASSATATYHDAFSVDVHTLSLLLRRNRDQHRRCIYFRRLTMVMSALRRLPSFEQVNGWTAQSKALARSLLDECDAGKDGASARSHSRRRNAKDERWTLEGGSEDAVFEGASRCEDDDPRRLHRLPALLQQLKSLVTRSIPEISSRVVHATAPVLCEISRGYFVPFHTVALACLGRIHTLLLRMGREVVVVLQEVVPQLRGLWERKRAIFKKDVVDWKTLEDLVISVFLVEGKENGNAKASTAAPQEWNNLMKHFLEVSQEDLTKQMNKFAKKKRWEDAMSRFGMGTEQLGGGLSSEDEIDAETRSGKIKTKDGTHSDVGELVSVGHPSCDVDTESKLSSGDAVDCNKGIIMKRETEKRSATSSTPGPPAPKKKRRKKKRGKRSIAEETIDHSDVVKPVEEEMGSARETSIQNSTALHEELENGKGKQSAAASTDNRKEELAMQQDSNHAEEPSEDVGKQKKSKKRSKKKSKKQKRESSSVIDDIFGS